MDTFPGMVPCRSLLLTALLVLFPAARALAADPVEPRAGVLLKGKLDFPREQQMSILTDSADGSKLSVTLGFDGRCKGGGLHELWASNVRTTHRVRARNGRIAATLTGSMRNVGDVQGRTGYFTWRLTGRFIRRDVARVTLTGSADVRSGGKTVSRCTIADPADARLAIRSA
jgi:hypothetical protein